MFKTSKIIVALLVIVVIFALASAAMADMSMKVPTGAHSGYWKDGTKWTADANRLVSVPAGFVDDAFKAGFTLPILPAVALYSTTSSTTATLTAAQMASAQDNIVHESGQTAAVTLTTPTAAQISAAQLGNIAFRLKVVNDNTSSGVITLSAGTNVSISGTATVAIGTTREFVASFATPTWTLTSACTVSTAGL